MCAGITGLQDITILTTTDLGLCIRVYFNAQSSNLLLNRNSYKIFKTCESACLTQDPY